MTTYSNPLVMSWGNCQYLYPYWKDITFDISSSPSDYIYGCREDLKNSIKALHVEYGSYDGEHVVVTNGATQALIGLLHILNKPAWALSPHFSRFPKFAEIAGVEWKKDYNGILIATYPNNPDSGWSDCSQWENKIADLSYNWPQYGNTLHFNRENIRVYSFSKAFGFPSTRIGWVLLKDEALAKQLEDYVEYSTAGVSVHSQLVAKQVINHQLYDASHKVFTFGNILLESRWDRIVRTIPRITIRNLDHTGMFLWVDNKSFYEERNIVGMSGEHFGGKENYYRLNIGCSEEDFNEFIIRCSR